MALLGGPCGERLAGPWISNGGQGRGDVAADPHVRQQRNQQRNSLFCFDFPRRSDAVTEPFEAPGTHRRLRQRGDDRLLTATVPRLGERERRQKPGARVPLCERLLQPGKRVAPRAQRSRRGHVADSKILIAFGG